MGYTHYNYRPRKNAGSAYMYGKLALDAKAICEHAYTIGIKLGDWSGENGTSPQFTEGEFSLNGIDDMSHETFTWKALPTQVEWRKNEPEIFDFCKTAQKPYDAVVTAILIRRKKSTALVCPFRQTATGASGKTGVTCTRLYSVKLLNVRLRRWAHSVSAIHHRKV